MKLRIIVTLKPGVLDPQGRAVQHALGGLSFDGVHDVRVGKLLELDVADGTDDATIDQMCRRLLANTVIENYKIERAEPGKVGTGFPPGEAPTEEPRA